MPGEAISYLKWENAESAQSAGIRSNSGVIEVKNKSGNWVDVAAWDRSGTTLIPSNLSSDTVAAGTLSCTFLGATGVIIANTISTTWVQASAGCTGSSIGVADAIDNQAAYISQVTELTTIASAATCDSTLEIPGPSIVFGLTARVTSTINITGGGTFSLMGADTSTVFSASIVTDKDTTALAMTNCPYLNVTAQKVRFTPNEVPPDDTGSVRLTVHYLALTAPTS